MKTYAEVMQEYIISVFTKARSITAAARTMQVNRNTADHWAAKYGMREVIKLNHINYMKEKEKDKYANVQRVHRAVLEAPRNIVPDDTRSLLPRGRASRNS